MTLGYNGYLKLTILGYYFDYLRAKERAKQLVKDAEDYAKKHNKLNSWETLWYMRKNHIPTRGLRREEDSQELKKVLRFFEDVVYLNDKRDQLKLDLTINLDLLDPADRAVLMKSAQAIFLNKE